jgi:putative copper resistance protein D
MEPRAWGPSALDDVHMGGAVMWIGGAAIMFVVIMATFFAWSRETRPSGGMGWLETARRANLAERFSEVGAVPAATPAAGDAGGVDDDDEHLAAYNAYLSHLNGPGNGHRLPSPHVD